MKRKTKVGRNAQCPCRSGKKYKHCCEGKVDWNRLVSENSTAWKDHLSVRGRNILFLERAFAALQLDKEPEPKSLSDFKGAFTPKAVREINEAIIEVWPKDINLNSVLETSRADVSGLYVGEYQTELLIRGVTRHSLYANKILLVDPFIYPLSVREQYNPILHPEQFRTQTLKNIHIWFNFIPWIEAGIVEFIRTPADFDSRLNWDSLHSQRKKYEESDELKSLLEETAKTKVEEFKEREALRMLVLSAPDDYLRRTFKESSLGTDEFDEDDLIAHVHELRKRDPYYLAPIGDVRKGWSEFHIMTTGASYEIARLTASITGSYLVTDLPTRWKEIELDREQHGVTSGEWSPIAKAFHNLDLRYLNSLELAHALSLRNEGRLENLRAFLRRIWSAASSGNPFGEENVRHLADELTAQVAQAEEEWRQIDRDLVKWAGGEAAAGLLAGGPLVASGHADFLAAAVAVAGVTTLVSTTLKRKGFPDKFPAAFFMDVAKKHKRGQKDR